MMPGRGGLFDIPAQLEIIEEKVVPLGVAVEKGQALDRRARFAAEFAAGKKFDRLVARIDHLQIVGVGID